MSDHDILSDAEREALSAVMLKPDLPPQRVLIVDDDKDARELLGGNPGPGRDSLHDRRE
jgi:PleD family two-component response regulator